MQPRPFEYHSPSSIEEALELLASVPGARLLAGGQSLVPALNVGEQRVAALVDISELGLRGVTAGDDGITVGALTRHRDLELGEHERAALPLAAEAVRHIGNPRVRNRGTFGGSVALGHPLSELAAVCLAQGAEVSIRSARGARSVAFADYLDQPFQPRLEPDEMVVAVRLDQRPPGSGAAFVEIAQRTDDYALGAAAAIVVPDPGGERIAEVRLGLVGAAPTPTRLDDAERLCLGRAPDDDLLTELRETIAASPTHPGDPFVSSAYRARIAGVAAARALAAAWARAE
ncbi:MAG: FAD binding domain-containing protein [Actinobacteria bacterium]|nr:FAD binding domain-containing protein [Actinomycetota bacterium]